MRVHWHGWVKLGGLWLGRCMSCLFLDMSPAACDETYVVYVLCDMYSGKL